jgi:hypothetical protein
MTNYRLRIPHQIFKTDSPDRKIQRYSHRPGAGTEALKFYIELEAHRFQHRFDYQIVFSKDLDITSIKVPPLILQPFVENAIHHGLMPKEGLAI